MKKIEISKAILENLYLNKKLSTYEIAKLYNCDASVIQRRLKEYRIKIRLSKQRIDIPKEKLKELYRNKNLSSYKIAKLLKIGRTTVYNKLIGYHIGTRPKKIISIPKNKLRELYYNKRMPLSKIANLYNCSPSIILDKMRNNNLKRRDKYESNTVYPKQKFENNLFKKAYMIGFRLGDLNVKQDSQNSSVIRIGCNTTKLDQVNLIKNIYGCYGHFWYKERRGVYNISFNMDKSFDFLLPKEDKIPNWILIKKKYFVSFLAGYTDAEGNVSISQKRARLRIRSYDKKILFQIYNKLNFLKINTKFGLACKKGVYYGVKHNKDCWGVSVNDKTSLLNLLQLLKPCLKHKKRYKDLLNAERNILERNKKFGIRNNNIKHEKILHYNPNILC